MVMDKKGFFYFVEIALVVFLVATLFFVFSPRAETTYQKFQDLENLETTGFGVLKSLNNQGILATYIDEQNMASSNFTALKVYIMSGLPETAGSRIEYAINSTTCYSESGTYGSCGLNLNSSLKKFEVTRADYTYSKRPSPITIHLYLWRIL